MLDCFSRSGLFPGFSMLWFIPMSPAAKLIIIFLLLWVAVHLLLYGYLRRRIAAAQRDKDAEA